MRARELQRRTARNGHAPCVSGRGVRPALASRSCSACPLRCLGRLSFLTGQATVRYRTQRWAGDTGARGHPTLSHLGHGRHARLAPGGREADGDRSARVAHRTRVAPRPRGRTEGGGGCLFVNPSTTPVHTVDEPAAERFRATAAYTLCMRNVSRAGHVVSRAPTLIPRARLSD